MTAPASTKLQVNFKTSGGTLINAYADNPDELVQELTALESLAGTIVAVEGLLSSASAAASVAAPPSQQLGQPAGGWGQPGQGNVTPGGFAQHEQQAATQGPPPGWAQQTAQSQAGFGSGPSCAHGAMVYKSGVSKTSGRPYSGHFCPSSNRADQCKPVFG